ncbi:PAS domain-containing protein, partial [Enterococcus faecium]|uniref:PAS domain-containing protein n=1 Tax=Enterococcus faecium TaxID=1352 RepID=UPI0030C87F71
MLTVQVFQIMVDNLVFHFEYLLFVLFAVILGSVLLESYTKLYRMNQKLSKLYKLVAESESNYRLIAENTSDLILVISEDKKISYLSPSHHSVLGYDYAYFMNMKLGTLLHPDDKEMFLTTIEKMFTTKKSSTLEFRLQ